MDWPVQQSVRSPGFRFDGTVFVLDQRGSRVSSAPWTRPNDEAADDALQRIGWTRTGPWIPDEFGRRTAEVMATAPREQIPLPRQKSPTHADEPALYFA